MSDRKSISRRRALGIAGIVGLALMIPLAHARAATGAEIEQRSRAKLAQLYELSPKAREVASRAKGILIFPGIVKAGLVVGGESGDGVLLVGDRPEGYYRISTLSVGLQAGAQNFAYVMFLMNDGAVSKVTSGTRWDIGGAPNIVIVDAGLAKSLNTLTLKKSVYAFPFGQKGLMAGLGLEGTGIERIKLR